MSNSVVIVKEWLRRLCEIKSPKMRGILRVLLISAAVLGVWLAAPCRYPESGRPGHSLTACLRLQGRSLLYSITPVGGFLGGGIELERSFVAPLPGDLNIVRGFSSDHSGIDLAVGDAADVLPVRAGWAGRIEFMGWHEDYLQHVEIDHGNGLHSVYGHLGAQTDELGPAVAAGQVLGVTVSSSAQWLQPSCVKQAHLHYGVIWGFRPIDPMRFILGDGGRRKIPSKMPGHLHKW